MFISFTVARCLLRATTHKGVNESHCAAEHYNSRIASISQTSETISIDFILLYFRSRIVLNLPLLIILERQIRLILSVQTLN